MVVSEDTEIGHRIREQRQAEGLSLRDLAQRTDLTASFLSQVERGHTGLSLGSLRRIAEGLGLPILFFLDEGVNAAPGGHPNAPKYSPIVPSTQRRKLTLPDSHVVYEMLVPDLSGKMEAFCARLGPGTGNVARRLREPTEEWIHVLTGMLKVRLTTDAFLLGAGDSIYFDGDSILELSCASDEEVVWISVITPPVF